MDCGQIFLCLQNTSQRERTDNSSPNPAQALNLMNETLIDSETHTINKICFTLAFLFSSAHIILMICFRRLSSLYGVYITLELVCFMLTHLLTLISCSVDQSSVWNRIVGKMADFTIMAEVAANLLSGTHVCRQLCLGATLTPLGSVKTVTDNINFHVGRIQFHWTCRPFYALLCVLIVVLLPGSILLAGAQIPKAFILTDDQMEFSNISCNLVPDFEHMYLFFPTIGTLLVGQLICLAVAVRMRYMDRQDGFLLAHLPQLNARLWISVKLGVTHCLLWAIAFTAILYASVALWHVFTLLCSLQAIFVTVNSVFSRPVLDLIHRWHGDRMDILKTPQTFVCPSQNTIGVIPPYIFMSRKSRLTTPHPAIEHSLAAVEANNVKWHAVNQNRPSKM